MGCTAVPKNAQKTVAFRKRWTNFMCHQCKGVRLLSEEARKTSSPYSNYKNLKKKKKIKLLRVPSLY